MYGLFSRNVIKHQSSYLYMRVLQNVTNPQLMVKLSNATFPNLQGVWKVRHANTSMKGNWAHDIF